MSNPYYETSSETINMSRMARQKAMRERIALLEQCSNPKQSYLDVRALVEVIKDMYLGIEELKEQVAILQVRSK